MHQRIGEDDHHDRRAHAEDRAVVDEKNAVRQAGDALAAGDDEREALCDAERAERRDERRDAEVGDERAVEHADKRADRQRNRQRRRERPRRDGGQRERHRAERQHGADREIEPLGQDHESHRQRDQQQHARLQQHVQRIARRREIRGGGREADEHDREHDDEAGGAHRPAESERGH
jgi:hypothetical protein